MSEGQYSDQYTSEGQYSGRCTARVASTHTVLLQSC
jgi:hypothetical protein